LPKATPAQVVDGRPQAETVNLTATPKAVACKWGVGTGAKPWLPFPCLLPPAAGVESEPNTAAFEVQSLLSTLLMGPQGK
jgi:hypothetical protein